MARPPKIAVVMSRFPKLTETFVLEEVRALDRQGAEVVLYPLHRERATVAHPAAAPWVAQARYLPLLSWPIVRSNLWYLRRHPTRYLGTVLAALVGTWGSRRYFVGALGMLPKVVHASRLMVAEGVDHVHCHFASHPAMAGFVVHRLTDIPFSFTAHGSDLHRDRHMLPQKVRDAAFVIAISEDNRRIIEEECAGCADHVHVVRCGVDTGRFAPAGNGHASPGPLRAITIGTLHEVKGQRHLIDACERALASGIDLQCEVVGDGPDRCDLERRVEGAGIGDRIAFVGELPAPQVRDALQRSDVLVAPSVPARDGRREGIPVVLMEAMACGLPVIASRLAGIPELVRDGVEGILLAPGDGEGIAAALKRLSLDPALREQMGAAGRERIRRRHDVDVNTGTLLRLIEAVR